LLPLALSAPSAAKDPLAKLPAPVAALAAQFNKECKSGKLGELVATDNFSLADRFTQDLNGDGAPDYFVYKCMFGCSEKPLAFAGIGTPCAWGNLLLSNAGKHEKFFVPGLVTRVHKGPLLRIALQLPTSLRLSGNFCRDGFPDSDPLVVYELRDRRFQLLGECPNGGGDTCFSKFAGASAQ
jgi:hypothetical protein